MNISGCDDQGPGRLQQQQQRANLTQRLQSVLPFALPTLYNRYTVELDPWCAIRWGLRTLRARVKENRSILREKEIKFATAVDLIECHKQINILFHSTAS